MMGEAHIAMTAMCQARQDMAFLQPRVGRNRERNRHKHKKHHKKSTTKNLLGAGEHPMDKSGNITDLGSKVIKEYYKPSASPRPSPRPAENSVEIEKDELNTSRSIKVTMKRRRSKTGDLIQGLGLKIKQVGNFIEEQESETENHKTEL